MNLFGLIIVALMALSILLIPLGLPGLWILVALVAVGAWLGEVSLWVVTVSVALAALAELAEWLIVRAYNIRHGGSPRAFWGAVIGGLVGVLVGRSPWWARSSPVFSAPSSARRWSPTTSWAT